MQWRYARYINSQEYLQMPASEYIMEMQRNDLFCHNISKPFGTNARFKANEDGSIYRMKPIDELQEIIMPKVFCQTNIYKNTVRFLLGIHAHSKWMTS